MNKETSGIVAIVVITIVVLGFLAWGLPKYKIYKLEMNGKAQLKEAEWNKQIAIEEARAEKEAAKLKKDADIIRAEGVAAANMIIAESLSEEYIRWKWVEGLHDGSSEVIYIPTEAGIPLMEARDIR